ncbi:MAG: hypothetical protein KME20_07915 [Kaiparowitsia implicata GSE-PSE-MK54-09C]|nr:hypothetical protein [Kaiparowitsia implicata GSE-PSE-MK54-09C]
MAIAMEERQQMGLEGDRPTSCAAVSPDKSLARVLLQFGLILFSVNGCPVSG